MQRYFRTKWRILYYQDIFKKYYISWTLFSPYYLHTKMHLNSLKFLTTSAEKYARIHPFRVQGI